MRRRAPLSCVKVSSRKPHSFPKGAAPSCGGSAATRAAIAKAEPEIVKAFGEIFGRLSASRRLPNRLLLLAHEDLSPWLVRFFSRIDFAQFTVTTRPFSPAPLSMDTLKELVAFEKDVALDVPLGIAAALVPLEIARS